MFNDITIGPVTLHMYGLLIAIGFIGALLLCNYRGKKRGLSEDTIWGIFFCAIIGGMIGSRLLFILWSFLLFSKTRRFCGILRMAMSFTAESSAAC